MPPLCTIDFMSMDSHRHSVSPLILTTSCTFSILASMLPKWECCLRKVTWFAHVAKLQCQNTQIIYHQHPWPDSLRLRVKAPVCFLSLFSPYVLSLNNLSVSHDSKCSFPRDLAKSHPHTLLFLLALSDDLCESTVFSPLPGHASNFWVILVSKHHFLTKTNGFGDKLCCWYLVAKSCLTLLQPHGL